MGRINILYPLVIGLASAIVLYQPVAFGAQSSSGINDHEALTVGLLSGSTATTTIGGALSMTLVYLEESSTEVLATYLDENSVALVHDLHLGSGKVIADLAAFFSVPEAEIDAFGRRLYEMRHQLLPLVAGGVIGEEQAREFTELLVAPAILDPSSAVTVPSLSTTARVEITEGIR